MTPPCRIRPSLRHAAFGLLLAPTVVLPCAVFAQTTTRSASTPFHLSGTLRDSVSDRPVPGAQLSASPDSTCSAATHASTITARSAGDGHFAFDLPCASAYTLTASAAGFPPQQYLAHEDLSSKIVLTRAQPSYELTFLLAPAGTITGLVLDEVGEAVRNAKVSLLTADSMPPEMLATTQTDDRGSYEFAGLAPNSLLIAVQAQPWYAVEQSPRRRFASTPQTDTPLEADLDVAYPITFFPGVTDVHSATAIPLQGGASDQADIHLSPVPAIHIRIPATSDSVIAPARGGQDRIRALPIAPPITQISVLGETPFRPTSTRVTPDGSLELSGFAPGTYQIEPRFGHGSSGDGSPATLELSRESPRTVDLASAAHKAESPLASGTRTVFLRGLVTRAGRPAVGALLLLVPADLAHGKDILRQQSNTDGSFGFEMLAPGRYILVAIAGGWSTNWHDPNTLTHYLTQGTPIALTAATVLSHAIEAQTN